MYRLGKGWRKGCAVGGKDEQKKYDDFSSSDCAECFCPGIDTSFAGTAISDQYDDFCLSGAGLEYYRGIRRTAGFRKRSLSGDRRLCSGCTLHLRRNQSLGGDACGRADCSHIGIAGRRNYFSARRFLFCPGYRCHASYYSDHFHV